MLWIRVLDQAHYIHVQIPNMYHIVSFPPQKENGNSNRFRFVAQCFFRGFDKINIIQQIEMFILSNCKKTSNKVQGLPAY